MLLVLSTSNLDWTQLDSSSDGLYHWGLTRPRNAIFFFLAKTGTLRMTSCHQVLWEISVNSPNLPPKGNDSTASSSRPTLQSLGVLGETQ